MEKIDALITTCPNGCPSILQPSGLVVAGWVINQCNLCGQLVSSCSKDYHEKANQEWNREEGTWPSKKDYDRLLKRKGKDIRNIARLLQKDYSEIRILDVGCSNGSFVFVAKGLGLQAEGVDTSEKAVNDGIKRGLNLHAGLLSEVAFDNESFDAITLYEVIEHLSDPAALFTECARILRPNGVLLIGTGNTDSWTRRIRKEKWDFLDGKIGHINFFSPNSLGVLGGRTGFSVVKIGTRSVKIFEKNEVPGVVYRITKIFTEFLNLPASLLNKGHQMEIYLKRR